MPDYKSVKVLACIPLHVLEHDAIAIDSLRIAGVDLLPDVPLILQPGQRLVIEWESRASPVSVSFETPKN